MKSATHKELRNVMQNSRSPPPPSLCAKSPTARIDIYTILGAWDGEPEKGLVSYQSALAQTLLSHKAGEQINVPTEHGERLVVIEKIEAYRK